MTFRKRRASTCRYIIQEDSHGADGVHATNQPPNWSGQRVRIGVLPKFEAEQVSAVLFAFTLSSS